MDANEIINHSAISRFFGVGENSITKNKIPNKYKYKYQLLIFFIEMWMKLVEDDGFTHKRKKE